MQLRRTIFFATLINEKYDNSIESILFWEIWPDVGAEPIIFNQTEFGPFNEEKEGAPTMFSIFVDRYYPNTQETVNKTMQESEEMKATLPTVSKTNKSVMIRLKLLLFIAITNTYLSFCQEDFDGSIFKEISKELSVLLENNDLKKEIKSINFTSFYNGEYTFDTLGVFSEQEAVILSNISDQRLITILLMDSLNFSPINNKITIVDTNGFFSSDNRFNFNGVKFKVIDKALSERRKEKKDYIEMYGVKLEDNVLILAFILNLKECLYLNFYFNIDSQYNVKLLKSKFLRFNPYHKPSCSVM